jgi:hypothetical protein
MNAGNESLSLFSRLTGLGIVGFAGQEPLEKEGITINEDDKPNPGNKKSRVLKFCQNPEDCRRQVNCQPGNIQNRHASVDLWFYLSSQS